MVYFLLQHKCWTAHKVTEGRILCCTDCATVISNVISDFTNHPQIDTVNKTQSGNYCKLPMQLPLPVETATVSSVFIKYYYL